MRALTTCAGILAARQRHSRRLPRDSGRTGAPQKPGDHRYFLVVRRLAWKVLLSPVLPMNAVALDVLDHAANDIDDSCPPTERVPASGLARLVASILPEAEAEAEADDDTLSRMPSLDLLARATGEGYDVIAAMREHYARDEMSEALAVAQSVLVVDDADIEEIDNAFLDFDYS